MKKLLILLSVLSIGCVSNKNITESIYWINSTKIECVGVGPMQCLQVKKDVDLNSGNWNNFYANIEGFDYIPGYLYKIKVKEEKLNPDNIPADASSIKYTLVEILNKEVDKKLRINDIWQVEKIGDVTLNSKIDYPTIEINVSKMKIIGKAICNTINGSIVELTENRIKFSPLATTRMMCPQMDEEINYLNAFSEVTSYHIANNRLIFLNDKGESLLTYKKVD